MSGQRKRSAFDCGPSTSTSLKIGSSSGSCGRGVEQVEDRDVVIKNEAAAAVATVFTDKLLIEKLIMYAIHDTRGNISPKMVGAVRGVQKSWLETTTTVLKKMEEPVITLDESNLPSLIKTRSEKGLKSLKQFTTVFTNPMRLQQSFLPFKLTMDRESFKKENFKVVMDCLTGTGTELIELEISYPIDEVVGIPLINFPLLRKLTFNFINDKQKTRKTLFNGDYNHNPVCSLNYILWGSTSLVSLTINQDDDIGIPKGIQCLRLPYTLESLEIGLKLESQELELLVLQLAHLKYLEVKLHGIPSEDEVLFKILNRCRKTLKTLKVSGFWSGSEDGPCPRTCLQVPVMKKLKTLWINYTECKYYLGLWCSSRIEQFLPKLTCVVFYHQTEAMLKKWLDNYKSDKIKVLGICLINEQQESDDDQFFVSVKPEMVAQVKTGFPNLTRLALHLNIGDMNALKYVFGNMKQLTILEIHLKGRIGNDGSSKMDSILLGLPFEVLRALKFLKSFEVEGEEQPGIVNLTELRRLVLSTENWDIDTPEDQRITLFSGIFFSHALLKMPKLCKLDLYNQFKPTNEMQQKWTEQEGRVMEYSSE